MISVSNIEITKLKPAILVYIHLPESNWFKPWKATLQFSATKLCNKDVINCPTVINSNYYR